MDDYKQTTKTLKFINLFIDRIIQYEEKIKRNDIMLEKSADLMELWFNHFYTEEKACETLKDFENFVSIVGKMVKLCGCIDKYIGK